MSLKIYNGLLVDIYIYHPSQTTWQVNPVAGVGVCLRAASKVVPYLEEIPLNSTVYTYADELPSGYIVYPAYYEARAQLRKSTAKLIMPCTPVYRFASYNYLDGFLNFTNSPNKAFDFS